MTVINELTVEELTVLHEAIGLTVEVNDGEIIKVNFEGVADSD